MASILAFAEHTAVVCVPETAIF